MKLFVWSKYDEDSHFMFAVADTVGQARLLVEDEYEWAKNNAPNQNLEDVFAEQINTEPEVYDLPAGYFLDIS